jgi:hypothetical protein
VEEEPLDPVTTVIENIPLISLVIGLAIAIRELRKGPSEDATRVMSSAVDLVDRMETRLNNLRREIDELRLMVEGQGEKISSLETENNWLKTGVSILIGQLQEHNIKPLWTVDSPKTAERPESDNEDKDNNRKWRGF